MLTLNQHCNTYMESFGDVVQGHFGLAVFSESSFDSVKAFFFSRKIGYEALFSVPKKHPSFLWVIVASLPTGCLLFFHFPPVSLGYCCFPSHWMYIFFHEKVLSETNGVNDTQASQM